MAQAMKTVASIMMCCPPSPLIVVPRTVLWAMMAPNIMPTPINAPRAAMGSVRRKRADRISKNPIM